LTISGGLQSHAPRLSPTPFDRHRPGGPRPPTLAYTLRQTPAGRSTPPNSRPTPSTDTDRAAHASCRIGASRPTTQRPSLPPPPGPWPLSCSAPRHPIRRVAPLHAGLSQEPLDRPHRHSREGGNPGEWLGFSLGPRLRGGDEGGQLSLAVVLKPLIRASCGRPNPTPPES
jgi:hypothetical protein